MAKILIVGRQEWKTKDRKTGETIEGLSYIGILPSGKPVKFTSREEYVTHTGEVEYDEKNAQEVNLLTKFFGGEISYQDGASFGRT